MTFLFILDLIGTLAFAISGAQEGAYKKLDFIGAFFLAFVTAMGGGIIRDSILGEPSATFLNPWYLYIVIFGASLSFLIPKRIEKHWKTILIFDALGLAVFTVIGTTKSLQMGLGPVQSIVLGMITGVGGGIIRDVLANEIPAILRKELYASIALPGALLYFILQSYFSFAIAAGISILFICIVRIIAIQKKLALPKYMNL